MKKTATPPTPTPTAVKDTATADVGRVTAPPDLRGDGEGVATAAARLFGIGAGGAPSEADTVPDGKVPEPEVTEEVPAAKADEDIVDYEGLRKLAAEKAAKRAESQGSDKSAALEARLAQLEAAAQANAADAEKFRKLQSLSKDSPIELIESLGLDPVSVAQNLHREAINREGFHAKKTVEQLNEEVSNLKQKLQELETGTEEKLTHREQAQLAEKNRREFVALTEDATHYPLLSVEDPADRLEMAIEAVRLLVEADREVSHEAVAKVAEAKLRKDLERRIAALGGELPGKKAQGATTKPSPKSISAELAGEASTPREKTQRERDLAAERLAAKIFLGQSPPN